MDKLEQEYYELAKRFKTPPFDRFNTPKDLKELGDLLKYRRMKKELKGVNEEKLAKILIKQLKDLITDLETF